MKVFKIGKKLKEHCVVQRNDSVFEIFAGDDELNVHFAERKTAAFDVDALTRQ